MARIERREARLRMIRAKIRLKDTSHSFEDVARTPEAHHHIGIAQNKPENIVNFVQQRQGDPAIKVCAPLMSKYTHG